MSGSPNCPQCGSNNLIDACFEEGCPVFTTFVKPGSHSTATEILTAERLQQLDLEKGKGAKAE